MPSASPQWPTWARRLKTGRDAGGGDRAAGCRCGSCATRAGLKPLETIGRAGPTPWLFGDRLRMGGVKLYADGALGSRGAWLKRPYADKPDTRGLQFLTDAELRDQAKRATAAGYQLAIHAIGDAANAQVISAPMRSSAKIRGRPPLADRACPDRRPGRHSAPRPRRDHRFDAADPPDQRPDDGREAGSDPPRLAGAYAWQQHRPKRRAIWRSAPTFRSNRPTRSPASPRRSAGRTRTAAAGRLAARRAREFRAGAGRLHPRRGLCRLRGGPHRRARARQMGRFHHRRPRRQRRSIRRRSAGTQVLETWVAGKKVWERSR